MGQPDIATPPKRRRGMRKAGGARDRAAALAGCAAILPQSPSAIFDLSAPGGAGNAPRGVAADPRAVAAQHQGARHGPHRGAPVARRNMPICRDAVWSDTLPNLLQARLVETLQNSGRVRAAALPGQGLLIDYQVVMDIRAFEFSDEGAVAEFAVKLMDDRNGRVVRTRVVRHVVPVGSTRERQRRGRPRRGDGRRVPGDCRLGVRRRRRPLLPAGEAVRGAD